MIEFSEIDRVLFFAPHPDDEALGAAGLLQRTGRSGARVRLVFATNGDDNPWAQRYVERRWRIAECDRLRWGELRAREARAAVEAMGLDRRAQLRFLNLRDQKITSLLRNVPARLSAILREEIDRFKPTVIIAPSIYDAHPDHSALSAAIALALERSDHPSTRCYYYIIHRPRQMPQLLVRGLCLSDEELDRKRSAIHCHRSQLHLFPERFTRFAQPAEIYYESDSAETVVTRYGFQLMRTSFDLTLELRNPELLQGAQEILLVFSPDDADPITWRIDLSSECRPSVLEDAGTGAFLGQINGTKEAGRLWMSLPARLLPESQAVYLKIVARKVFFDRFGWFRMILPVLRQPVPEFQTCEEARAEPERFLMGEHPVDCDVSTTPSHQPLKSDGGGPIMKPSLSLGNGSRSSRWQIWIFRLAIAAFVVSRLILAWQQPIDSDEPQHAHVAWAWAHGFVQYRDVFDNHTPLFHLLSTPLAALIGDRADILALLRCGIIVLNLITLFLVWRLCSSLFSAQAARWVVIALAFFPPFFLYGAEFRTDALWTTLWVAWIAVVTSRIDPRKRCFWGGLLMAACFSVSLKSFLLLLTIAIAFAAALALRPRFAPAFRKIEAGAIVNGSILALAGFVVFAGSIVGLFIALGAGPAMYRCVVEHNLAGNDVDLSDRLVSSLLDPRIWLFVPALYFVAFQLAKFDSVERRFRIALLVLFTSFYPLLLRGIWPVVTRQDFLPYYPLLCASLSLLIWTGKRLSRPIWSSPLMPLASFAVLLLVEGGWSTGLLLRKHSADPVEVERIGQVLRLTKPGETVLDPKGEVVLRPRPIYDVLELFTMKEYRDNVMKDRIPEQLIARHTMVAVRSDRYPEHTRRFLQENYLVSGRLLIAGVEAHENAGGAFQFHLSLGGSYVFLSNGHQLSGKLNGVQISGKAEMQPGFFEFVPDTGDWPVTIQWERAYQMGIIGGCDENLPWHGTRPRSL
jgi:LmbE family N-acetylglucosaminyl deacetylase